MPTPHNSADPGDIAQTILLPGDPQRAKMIAESFFEDATCFNEVRGMLGFTGTFQGHPISVMGTGMGMPSIGIVAHELISYYGARTLIRVGSCGAYREGLDLGDIIIAQGACTDSNFAHQYGLPGTYSAIADFGLLLRAAASADEMGLACHVGNVLSSDVFYSEDADEWRRWEKMGVLAAEMESYALYCEAARTEAKALGIFTISDNIATGASASAEQRQNDFDDMVRVALGAAFGSDATFGSDAASANDASKAASSKQPQ